MSAEILSLRSTGGRRTGTLASVQGTLALDLLPQLAPPTPEHVPARPGDIVRDDEGVRQRVDRFVAAYLQAAVEIAIGDRPPAQLLRHSTHEVHQNLARRALLVRTAAGTSPLSGRGRGAVRPVVVGTRTSLVREDALEASAHVRHGQRSRAVAARFEVVRGRWQCVALEFA